ncbi:globin [Leucobacter komagatae]|uniref:Globin n=1 Tax=Leucobacter komagatae TaxID=55969 RepID=A0A0D0I2B4_9MICO|nr:globin [Leucobacter komagatae]KIP53871.1 globin [Leucobacter komagatae]
MTDDQRSAKRESTEPTGSQGGVSTSQGEQTPPPRLTLRSGESGHAVTDTVWSQVGGSETFEKIARAFYRGVREDEVLAPMYPEDDWEGATWRIQAFLEQYWGGPSAYQEQRGHPRLRMRHNAFPVTPDAKERWLKHMHAALDEVELPPMHDAAFRDYIERAALALVNRFE